jgi:hypothetical protein
MILVLVKQKIIPVFLKQDLLSLIRSLPKLEALETMAPF